MGVNYNPFPRMNIFNISNPKNSYELVCVKKTDGKIVAWLRYVIRVKASFER